MAEHQLKDCPTSPTVRPRCIHGDRLRHQGWRVLSSSSAPAAVASRHLLRMVAGLGDDHRRRDRRSAAGWSTSLEPAQRDIAMVFQNYALYPHMSVYKNMAYGLKIQGMRQGRDRRVGSTQVAAEILETHSTNTSNASRGSSPAGSASGLRWGGRSCASRRCSCSTNRCPTSTPSCGCRCGSRSRSCRAGSVSPAST